MSSSDSNGNESRYTTRLMITKMVLENFKSYAGKQEIGPFHKRFSSIVGPNGSGKSNVIDALLFVFGKRAKQLRLNKVSELIHKSSNYSNLEYAQVDVFFQLIKDNEADEDDFEVIPGSEFVVSRVAYQNNQSKYTVNSTTSSFTEVGTLLRSHGIDLDNNRFLILQGEVEQIAMMKPKGANPHEEGLLEYLEDIIGSNRFVEKIEEISKQLDEINEQRVERVNRLKLAERERDNLSGSKLEAEEFLEKEKEIRRTKNVLYQIFQKIADDNVNDLTERLNRLNEKFNYEKSKLSDHESNLLNMEKNHQDITNQYNAVDAELQKTKNEFTAFERRDVKIQEDLKHNQAQLKKVQANIAKDSKKETECLTEVERATSQLSINRKQLNDLEAKKSEEETTIEAIMTSLQEETKPLRAKLEVAQGNLAEAERSVGDLQIQKESMETQIQLLQSRCDGVQSTIQSTQAKLIKVLEEKASVELQSQKMNTEKSQLTKEITTLENHLKLLSDKETSLQSKVRQSLSDTEEAKALQSAQSQRSGVSGNPILAAIMKAASSKGALSKAGIVGRLGDLASIDNEYDVAISTACGMLDYIVCETTEGAQMCMNYLRDNNIGRASFVLLDQMNEWKMRCASAFKTPTGTHRLFDLIHLDESIKADLSLVRGAFYMALKDTLVAETLDSAVAIAYVGDKAAYRVVTRSGDLIDVSGAMSGGGNSVRSGSMKLTNASKKSSVSTISKDKEITTEMIAELEKKQEQFQLELKKCREETDVVSNKLKDTQKSLKNLLANISKSELVYATFGEQETELQARITKLSQESQLTPDEEKELKKLCDEYEAIERNINKVSPNLKGLRQEVSSLQAQVRDVGGPKLGKAQARLDLISSQMDKLQASVSSLEIEETNNRKQVTKLAATRQKSEQELAKLDSKVKDLIAEQKEMEDDALLVIQAVEAAKTQMTEKEQELKNITKEFNDMKVAVSKIKSVQVDLQVEIERNQKDIKENKEVANGWKLKLDAIAKAHLDEQKEFSMALQSATSNIPLTGENKDVAVEFETLPTLSTEELAANSANVEELKRTINLLEAEKDRLKANVNMNALLEYLKKDAFYRVRVSELEAITEERNVIRRTFEDLRRQRLEEFMAGFGIITLKLKEMYQMITLGGDAELELVDSLDPFSEGIVFSVRPPKKSWKNISNLSGGEKTLSSLALVFALHHFKPTPLYVMDEIDAALDFKNVSIVANYIKDRTKNAQFVIISLRNNMFELADRLVGIYKTHDATKSVTINPKMFQAIGSIDSEYEPVSNAKANVKGNVSALPKKALRDITNTVV